jgi:hypothetical protein
MDKKRWAAMPLAMLLAIASILAQSPQASQKLEDPPWVKELVAKRIVSW